MHVFVGVIIQPQSLAKKPDDFSSGTAMVPMAFYERQDFNEFKSKQK